jgi:hypothetical protein
MHKIILNHAAADQRRKKKEEGRKKEKGEGTAQGLAGAHLAGARLTGSRWVSPETHDLFFFFFRPWVSQPHLAVTVAVAVSGFLLVLG